MRKMASLSSQTILFQKKKLGWVNSFLHVLGVHHSLAVQAVVGGVNYFFFPAHNFLRAWENLLGPEYIGLGNTELCGYCMPLRQISLQIKRRRKILKVGGLKIRLREKFQTTPTLGQTAPIFERSTLLRLDFLHKRTNGKSSRADLAAT